MPARPIPVFFVYRRGSVYRGSTLMRAIQLCQIMQRHGSARFDYSLKPIGNQHFDWLRMAWVRRQPKGAVFILVKDAVMRLHQEALFALQERAGLVAMDHIDRGLDRMPEAGIDLHIASSIAQQRDIEARLESLGQESGRCGLLLHQADIRLADGVKIPTDRFAPAYFGHPANAAFADRLRDRVTIVDAGESADMDKNIAAFATANFHYAVRPPEQTVYPHVFKPLTKAVTAAACGAPVMVNRTAPDAEALLGADYPYLLDDVTAEGALSMLDRVASDFGGPVWADALETMHTLANRVSPAQTARTLETLMEAAL